MDDILSLMRARHSVRQYRDTPIEHAKITALRAEAERCNAEGGLAFQLIVDEPDAFGTIAGRYGRFSNARNYFIVAGRPDKTLEERCGYYGEELVLRAQALGLNTCWVAGTFSRRTVRALVPSGCKMVTVIVVGYGATQGRVRKSKTFADVVADAPADAPAWFQRGIEAALLAPTALNQQRFAFSLSGSSLVTAKAKLGPYTSLDLGIVKHDFETAAGPGNFTWA